MENVAEDDESESVHLNELGLKSLIDLYLCERRCG